MAARALKALLRGHARGRGALRVVTCRCRGCSSHDPPGTHNKRHFCTSRRAQPHPPPPMTIEYMWGRHPSRQKKGVHLRSGAGRRPNDGRASSVEMHSGLGVSDVPSPNPCQSHSSRLVAGPCMQGWSSESGCQGRDCADSTLGSPVHPSLWPDVGVDGDELLQVYMVRCQQTSERG